MLRRNLQKAPEKKPRCGGVSPEALKVIQADLDDFMKPRSGNIDAIRGIKNVKA